MGCSLTSTRRNCTRVPARLASSIEVRPSLWVSRFFLEHSDHELQPRKTPLADMDASSTVDWCFDELSHFVLSPGSVGLPVLSLSPRTENVPETSNGISSIASPTENAPEPPNRASNNSSPTQNTSEHPNDGSSTVLPCTCFTTIINLLLYRSKMRREIVSKEGATLRHELEALMQQGLSLQQRCNLCLEDPLVSMIWARITDEYLTTVIASRKRE